MAINFPNTLNQPTDGTFTHTVGDVTWAWNGSSWAAAGSGASAVDLTVFSVAAEPPAQGDGSLTYDPNTGTFTYTPPDLSSYLQSETDPVFGASAAGGITSTNINQWNQAYGWGDHGSIGYLLSYTETDTLASVLARGNTATANINLTGTVSATSFSGDGSSLTGINGLQSRQSTSATASFLANNGSANLSIVTPPGYALLAIGTSHASWVTLYMDTTSRTADAGRLETQDPLPGSGVLAEVITSGNTTQYITPGTIGFNSSAQSQSYIKVVNKSGATANVQVTLTYIQIEV